MNKKLFALLVVAIIAIVSIGAVNAFDLGSLLGGGNTVTVDGVNFNVPDGFEEVVRNTTTKYNKTVDNIAYFSFIKRF